MSPNDAHSNPSPDVQDRAEKVLRRLRIGHGVCSYESGRSNDVLLLPHVALRMSRLAHDNRLSMEVELTQLFSEDVGHPQLLEHGRTDGYEWTLSKRLPGINMAHAWPRMSFAHRKIALSRAVERLSAVHEASVDRFEALDRPPRPWYQATDPRVFVERLEILQRTGLVDGPLAQAALESFSTLQEGFPPGLASWPNAVVAHGDAHIFNFNWDESTRDVFPMDFNGAIVGPIDLDLDKLLWSIAYKQTSDMSLALPINLAPVLKQAGRDGKTPVERLRLFALVSQVSAAWRLNGSDFAAECVETIRHLCTGRSYVDKLALALDHKINL